MPPTDVMLAIAPPSGMRGISVSVRWRRPTKFTSVVSRFENGGPGMPAQLKSRSIDFGSLAAAASIDARSLRSQTIDCFTGASTGFTSSACTSAPRSTSVRAAAAPMPENAPVIATTLPE